MANIRSAEKQNRQSIKHRAANRAGTSRLRTQIKRARTVIASGDKKEIQAVIPETYSVIDRAASKGLIKGNTADRYKSRLNAAAKKAVSAK